MQVVLSLSIVIGWDEVGYRPTALLPDRLSLEERMKPHLAKLSLALLSAVFLLGCQERGPVGPDGSVPLFHGKPCKGPHKNDGGCGGGGGGDGPKKNLVDVTVTGGMKTDPDAPQKMDVFVKKKNDRVLLPANVDRSTKSPYFFLQIAMTTTHNAAEGVVVDGFNEVVIEDDGSILYKNSTDPLCVASGVWEDSQLIEIFNRLRLPSVERAVRVVIDAPTLMGGVSSSEAHAIQIGIDGIFFEVRGPTLTVSVVGDVNSNDFTATFRGGRLNAGFGTRTGPALSCDNLDAITFTVGGG